GQAGIVRVTILPGQERYDSSFRNGVTTGAMGSWYGSYRVEAGDLFASTRNHAPREGAQDDPLPEDARKILADLEQKINAIQKRVDEEIMGPTAKTIQ